MSKIAFLGLGVMGYPMAGHIAAAGHEVTVYNRTTARAEAWVAEHGGSHAPTPAAAAAGADIVLSCVGDDPDVLQVALGSDGAIPAMREGAIYIDNSTVSADVARKLAAAGSERGISALDAPVSGGQAGAENGKLTVMVGGAAQSWQMVNRGQTMVRNEFDFGFALDWMRKDLRICFEEAERTGATLPMTEIVAGYYDELSAAGHGRNDTSALIRRLRKS